MNDLCIQVSQFSVELAFQKHISRHLSKHCTLPSDHLQTSRTCLVPRKCLLAEQHSTNWYLQNTPQLQYTRKTRENVNLNNKRYFQFSSLLYSPGNNIQCLFLVTCFLNKHLVVSFITHVGLWSTGQVQTKPPQSGSSQGSRLWDNLNHEPRGWCCRELGWYALSHNIV